MGGLVRKYGGDYSKALSVYNSGQPNAYLDPAFAGGQTYRYVRSILGNAKTAPVPPPRPVPPAAPSLHQAVNNTSKPAPNRLLDPAVQAAITSNDRLLGIAAPDFSALTANQPQAPAQPGPARAPQVAVHGVRPASPHDTTAVQTIEKYLGTPYVWGGASPKGFDCSGLLQYVWGQQGVKIPRTSYQQWQTGKAVGRSQLQPGDAVFFKGSDSMNGLPGHVGMYIGGGRFVEAPHTGSVVRISTLAGRGDYMGARRYI